MSTSAEYTLLAPGPVNLHPEVRKILSLPMLHHRIPEFEQIFSRVLSELKNIFQTENPVFIHSSTGSGGMESLLVNTISPGEKVLALVSGKFGERWAEIAEVYGADVHRIPIAWGKAAPPEDVEKFLKAHPDTRAVLCQACETSTAVAHPIQEIGKIISRHPETLFLVDGITAVGAYDLPMDHWGIDGLVAGSQKAFMLPTGLSFVSFSKKAWSFVQKAKCPRFYFDVRKEKAANAKGESFFSAPVPLIRALDFVLQDIKSKTLEKHFSEIRRRASLTRKFAPQLGFTLYAEAPSDSVTALNVPAGIDGQKLRQQLEDKYNITLMGGQDQAKGKIIRIGHMGYIQDQDMLRLFQALGEILISSEELTRLIKEITAWQKATTV